MGTASAQRNRYLDQQGGVLGQLGRALEQQGNVLKSIGLGIQELLKRIAQPLPDRSNPASPSLPILFITLIVPIALIMLIVWGGGHGEVRHC